MEEKIEKLEKLLQLKEQEIIELRSQLDKFQSVFPFKMGESPFVAGQARVRKQRAQGISAEPQTIHDLSQKKFPSYPKND
ncbi:cGMP-dependent protein kinase, partial [Sarracenia purpurea var. burkii]